jgi:two-component system NarL family response regulator
MVSVMLAEDHEITRCGIRAILYRDADIEIVGECEEGSAVAQMMLELKPDVLILDLDLPNLSGFQVLEQLRALELPTRVLVLTDDEDEWSVRQAFALGVHGYALKRCSIQALSTAIRANLSGGCWLDTELRAILFENPTTSNQKAQRQPSALSRRPDNLLSPRETEILSLIAAGRTNIEIGRLLSISPETVKTHVRSIMEKLDAKDRTQAAVKGMQLGAV